MFGIWILGGALVTLAVCCWEAGKSWGETIVAGIVIAGLGLTFFVPFGGLVTVVLGIWLHQQARSDRLQRLAEADDAVEVDDLPAEPPKWAAAFWIGVGLSLVAVAWSVGVHIIRHL